MFNNRFMPNILKCRYDLETKVPLIFYFLCKYRFRFYSKTKIKKYQDNKKRFVLESAVKNSKFFRSYYKDFDFGSFSSLPTINKRIMMQNLSDYNTVGLKKEQIIDFCLEVEKSRDFSRRLEGFNVGMSSGTSGNKGVEIVSPREENYMKAALFARFDFPKKEKINLAFILRVSAPAFCLNKFGHKLTYVSQLNSIEIIGQQLEDIMPNTLSAPPSMLKIIAKQIEKGKLSIEPKRVISYAEVLYADVKKYLGDVFKCPVHEIYKCTEGPIAITCKYGSLHINEDLVFAETLNKDGTETEPGKPCWKLIITDLHKTTQPIIRYELNDIITISPDQCPCGSVFRVIKRVQGRSDDMFWARSLKTGKWQFIIPDYISRALISSTETIDEYQVVQESPNKILVRLKLKEGCSESEFEQQNLKDNFNKLFCEYDCGEPYVKIVFEDPAINKNSKKLIRIFRNFQLEQYEQ
jgi:putative adenylate-forming enzyme